MTEEDLRAFLLSFKSSVVEQLERVEARLVRIEDRLSQSAVAGDLARRVSEMETAWSNVVRDLSDRVTRLADRVARLEGQVPR